MEPSEDAKMDRKAFLKRMLQTGAAWCGAAGAAAAAGAAGAAAGARGSQAWIADLEQRMVKGSESPGWVKAEKAEYWIKAMMEHMDGMLDQEAKVKLMQACGRSCYLRAFGVSGDAKPPREELDKYLKFLEDNGTEFVRDGDTVSFTFSWGRDHQNPWGLMIRDGYCMCPLVESGPPGLSPTFCYCSTGYVQETFERITGKPVRVKLLESLKSGGNDCVFRITVLGL
jgi:hypothetical protein